MVNKIVKIVVIIFVVLILGFLIQIHTASYYCDECGIWSQRQYLNILPMISFRVGDIRESEVNKFLETIGYKHQHKWSCGYRHTRTSIIPLFYIHTSGIGEEPHMPLNKFPVYDTNGKLYLFLMSKYQSAPNFFEDFKRYVISVPSNEADREEAIKWAKKLLYEYKVLDKEYDLW